MHSFLHIAMMMSQTGQRNGIIWRCAKGHCDVQNAVCAAEKNTPYVFPVCRDISKIFQKYTRQKGASGNINPMNKRIIHVFSDLKHVEADIVRSSSSSGIFNSGRRITATKLLLFVRSTSGAQCCVAVHACLY